ncbi:MAG: bifunctional hydroxymethylpyrimidine kinase/phosphomethylpyrimidine kinase, partial [Syntrophales bacterium]|nr:bifunctional hydroxymethylpyrimidine kinase/phosphomethylpyrimidine kinase [Syntrophales bacterium]
APHSRAKIDAGDSLSIKKILTIAGSDSGGGAGIQADIKTIAALGGYGMTVITALTAQNTRGVEGILEIPTDFIAKQFHAVVTDIGIDAVKTGMLSSSRVIDCVTRLIEAAEVRHVVVDPVMAAKGGSPLLQEEAREALMHKLLPLATVVTPNVPEAELMTGLQIRNREDMKEAARIIHTLGAANVVVKGGHLTGEAVDVLFDGRRFQEFGAARLETQHTHGTGCTFAAAIATLLAQGYGVVDAVAGAKDYVTEIVRFGLPIGAGHGPMNHLMPLIRRAERYDCVVALKKAVARLKSFPVGHLVPQVQMNFGYALTGAQTAEEVAAYPGRLVRVGEHIENLHDPEFGASRHIASVILAAMRWDPSYRAAVNIRYGEEVLRVLRMNNYRIASFDRAEEPPDVKLREGATLDWGTQEAIRALGTVPDVVYDLGEVGKEPVIRVLGRHPDEVADKVLKIARALVGENTMNRNI